MNTEIPITKYFFLTDFDDNTIREFLNLLNNTSPDNLIEINLSSCGGAADVLFSILKIINDNPERFTLVISGACDSAAIDLTLMTDCKKQFLQSFIGGIMHNIAINVSTRDLEDSNSDPKHRYVGFSKLNRKIAKYFESLNIDPDKIAKLKKGEDVFLTREEIVNACKYKVKNEIFYNL